MPGLGKRVPPLPSICGPFHPPPPWAPNPESQHASSPRGPWWRHTSWPQHIHQKEGFWIGGESANSTLSPCFLSHPFCIFHSYALTEAIYHVNSPVLSHLRTLLTLASGRPGNEPLHSSAGWTGQAQRWACRAFRVGSPRVASNTEMESC